MSTILSALTRAVGIAITVYIYYDAPKRRRNRWLWAILALLFGLLVLGIYLILTKRKLWGIICTIVGAIQLLFAALLVVATYLGVQS